MVECRELGLRYGSRWVLRKISIQVAPGQSLAIRGANGSGKSSLIRILAGLHAPTEGTVQKQGRLGYLALDLHLYPSLTARQHLEFASRVKGISSGSDLADFGLSGHEDNLVSTYSTGMRTRLKFAMMMLNDPDILLLDEPTAALDEAGQELLAHHLSTRNDRVVLLATNDPSDLRFATHELTLA